MNKTILAVIILAILSGCRAWDASMLATANQPISPKLLTLERKIGDISNISLLTNSDEVSVFTKEVENNLMDPYGDKYGYIVLKKNVLSAKVGAGLYMLSSMLLTIPNILGMPFMNIRYKVEVEIRIYDKENRLVAKYASIGNGRAIVAYYYGYSMASAYRKAYPEALLDAFNKIRPQIQTDAERVNEKLKALGK